MEISDELKPLSKTENVFGNEINKQDCIFNQNVFRISDDSMEAGEDADIFLIKTAKNIV